MGGNYIPLYRKYRPQTLETLVGQEHIKKTLTSAIELGKISHAYLFTGPRGTGKTSTARILAKSLNCIKGPTTQPCGECESCKNITNSVPIDVIEIDAASNRKVEDAQNLLEKIQYAPINGKYKIYIIDEVHMLSNTAFNALLKTLEEPPQNVIFILATTEVHKVLDTIKSRCQRFDFRRITTNDIVKHLRQISDKENIKISDDALFAIAKNSAGGMRDSLSLLDQLSILGISEEITLDDVNSILGRISFDVLFNLTNNIINSDSAKAIELLNNVYNSGNEPLQILTNLSEYFKNILIVKKCSKDLIPELTGLNEPQVKDISAQAKQLETQQIVFLIERIAYYIKEIKLAVNQHLWLEVGIIDLSNMAENSKLLDLQNRLNAIENGQTVAPQTFAPMTRPAPIQPSQALKPDTTDIPATKSNTTINTTEINKPEEEVSDDSFSPPPISKKLDENNIGSMWQALLSNIDSVPTRAMLKLATPIKIEKDEVIITFKAEALVSQINSTNKKQQIQEAANKLFNTQNTPVTIRLASSSDVVISSDKEVAEKKTLNKPTTPSTDSIVDEKADTSTKTATTNNTIIENKPNSDDTESNPQIKKNKKVDKSQTDQEKIVLDLFDGKYVE